MQKLIWQNSKGDTVDLTAAPYGITEWDGFSNAGLNIQSQQVPFQDGAVFLDALIEQRELEITLAIQDNNNLETRYQLRRELISILNPKLGEGYLIYTNDFISKRIKCIPQIPLFETHNSNDSGTPKASLSWTACEPYWEDLEETEVFLKSGEIVTINNEGDIPTQMEIEFLTTNAINPSLIRMNDDKKIKYDGELDNNLYINTNNGKKQVYSENITFDISKYDSSVRNICYSSELGIFVGVSDSVIYFSYDGINWTFKPLGFKVILSSILYNSNLKLFVAVGENGVILTSSDGINWTVVQTSGVSNWLYSITYSDELNLFVAVGGHGVILTSPDAITWTSQTSGVSFQSLYKVIYSDELNLFVVVGGYGPTYGTILTSTDGINWTVQADNLSQTLSDVVYSSELNLFVAVGDRSFVLTSSDTITWTTQTIEESLWDIKNIAYSSELNLFVAAGGGTEGTGFGIIWTSPDGINWTWYSHSYTPLCIIYSNELHQFIIGCSGGFILSTLDGANLNILKQGSNPNIRSIAYSDELDLFVAVGNSVTILTSTDRITWTRRALPGIYNITFCDVIYSDKLNLFIIAGAIILTSPDGINWTRRGVELDSFLYSITYSDKLDLFVAVGKDGVILTSPDAINWTERTSNVTDDLKKVIYSDKLDLFVVVGDSGIILTSPDAITWTERTSGVSKNLMGVAYSDELNLFVAVGEDETILRSPDGITWISQGGSSILTDFYSITYDVILGVFIIITSNKIFKSIDGLSLSEIETNLGMSLGNVGNVIYFDDLNLFIVVGQCNSAAGSLILFSSFSPAENQIQNISSDSDMNLNILMGENKFRVLKDAGSVNCKIKYRQKYIGV